jgi:membrane protease YdiL (CAAX protease family)
MLNARLIDLMPQLSALGAAMPDYRLTDLLLFAIVLVAMPVSSVISGRKLARTPREETNLANRYISKTVRAIVISALILLSWHWLDRPYSALGLATNLSLPAKLAFGIDVVLVCYLFYALLLQKIPAEKVSDLQKRMESLRITPRTPAEFATFPLLVLTASPMEELLYRGYLFWALTPLTGLWGAVALSSILFGVAHAYQGWFGILRTALIGLAFAIGFALTHSLWWLMLTHILMNASGTIYSWKIRRLSAAAA